MPDQNFSPPEDKLKTFPSEEKEPFLPTEENKDKSNNSENQPIKAKEVIFG